MIPVGRGSWEGMAREFSTRISGECRRRDAPGRRIARCGGLRTTGLFSAVESSLFPPAAQRRRDDRSSAREKVKFDRSKSNLYNPHTYG